MTNHSRQHYEQLAETGSCERLFKHNQAHTRKINSRWVTKPRRRSRTRRPSPKAVQKPTARSHRENNMAAEISPLPEAGTGLNR
ncbi:Hypothetical predicted protein [Pelobates cultripes]|uniref:Uncharacterized protein n=1 Tax=Pelobates cultripes TaxID=61616 RepID=A0AAD1WBZ2_PELCU|nr:Hypothetical predicted protein [Pelobates cultripes]